MSDLFLFIAIVIVAVNSLIWMRLAIRERRLRRRAEERADEAERLLSYSQVRMYGLGLVKRDVQ